MKRLLLILALSISGQAQVLTPTITTHVTAGGGPITWVGTAKAASLAGSAFTSTETITTSTNDLMFMWMVSIAGCTDVPESTPAASWTKLTTQALGGEHQGTWAWAKVTSAGSTVFTNNYAGMCFGSLIAYDFHNGKQSSPIDQQNGNDGSGGNVTSRQPGSVTPSEDNEVVVAGIGWNSATTMQSVNGGFSTIDVNPLVGGASYGSGAAYLIQTTAAAANPTFSWTLSVAALSAIATAKKQ